LRISSTDGYGERSFINFFVFGKLQILSSTFESMDDGGAPKYQAAYSMTPSGMILYRSQETKLTVAWVATNCESVEKLRLAILNLYCGDSYGEKNR